MKEFLVERVGPGEYHVMHMRPHVIARCEDENAAYMIAGLLNGQTDTVAEDPAPAVEDAPQEPKEDPEPGPDDLEPPGPPEDEGWTEEELSEHPSCILCGRHFKATPDRLDRCARCSDAR